MLVCRYMCYCVCVNILHPCAKGCVLGEFVIFLADVGVVVLPCARAKHIHYCMLLYFFVFRCSFHYCCCIHSLHSFFWNKETVKFIFVWFMSMWLNDWLTTEWTKKVGSKFLAIMLEFNSDISDLTGKLNRFLIQLNFLYKQGKIYKKNRLASFFL